MAGQGHISMKQGIACALAAAALFGASTPFAKCLVGDMPPLMLAGLLYLGSGCGLAILLVLRRLFAGEGRVIAWPARTDWGWLAGAILCGGILGPVLLMIGLATSGAVAASLLLNFESVLTAMIAWFVFRENFDRRIASGMALIVAGAVALSWAPETGGIAHGSLLIIAACAFWAIDNNLTRKVSASDAVVVAGLKGLVAGGVSLACALWLGQRLPPLDIAIAAAGLGFASYGVSLVLFVLALRQLGAARTGAYFAVAPFFGAVLALVILQEPATLRLAVAGALMATGVYLHLTERHDHVHAHAPLAHEHAHRHDEHHRHGHDFSWDGTEPHTHPHVHDAMVHGHPHFPDIHHRH
jgi:drug/metabolite transporter (DMT)-like permease